MKTSRGRYRTSLATFTILLLASVADAATITVTSTADAGGTCPGMNCTLRQAIATAAGGDTIDFALPANSAITLTSAELVINKNMTIDGPGANLLTVRRSTAGGTPLFRIFNVAFGFTATISGLTIANGNVAALNGGGILSSGKLTLINATVSGNGAASGGGIAVQSPAATGTVTIANSTISGNVATVSGSSNGGGGIYISGGVPVAVSNSTISGNSGQSNLGGGILIFDGQLTITNSTISGNSTLSGAGVYNGAQATLRNTIVALNTAGMGGFADLQGSFTSQGYNLIGNNSGATITPTTGDQIGAAASPINPMLGPLQDNGGPTATQALLSGSTAIERGDSGGANTDQRGFARPVDSPAIANVGDGSDIGAYEVQADQLPGCSSINRVVNNNNDAGTDSLRAVIANVCAGSTITFAPNVTGAINLTSGELQVDKSLTINGPGANVLSVQRSTVAGTPDFRIFNITSGRVIATVSGLTIANGKGNGGGIFNTGTLTLSHAVVSDNAATSALLTGGGISNSAGAVLTVTHSTISGNSANQFGGIRSNGTLTVTNSTISGNMALSGNGGGIGVSGGPAILTNSTIAGNSASGAGGGVYNSGVSGASVRGRNTLIGLNTGGSAPDVSGTFISEGFNFVGNGSGATITPANFSDQIGTAGSPINPMLGPLQNNGGPTFTRALLAGSTAIDKGNASGATTDQRGFLRPIGMAAISGGDGSDIGAFEFGSSLTTLANISTRLAVQTGDNVLIGGFIITGTQPKKVILRALGPSLNVGGTPVPGRLGNTTLELVGPSGTIAINDDWRTTQEAEIIASTVPPPNDLESAIVATLPANTTAYTTIVRGAGNTSGVGQVEVYDLDRTVDSQLANISTRGLVQAGDNVMIGGIIVVGPGTRRVIVRALGPSLNVGGNPIPGRLPDSTLEIANANGMILFMNDDWRSTQEAEIIATTVPPPDNLESAIVATLPAAPYTAIVRGKNGATGIGQVEAFGLAN